MDDNLLKELEQIPKNAKIYVIRTDETKRDFDSSKIKEEFAYGSCYGNEIEWSQGSAVDDQWYPISDASMENGELNLVTHDGRGKLTIGVAGVYSLNYCWSGGCSNNNDHVQIGFLINASVSGGGMNHFETEKADSHQVVSGTAIAKIPSGGTLQVAIRTTDANTPTITTDHLSITAIKLGKDLQGLGSFVTTQSNDLKKQRILK